MMEFIADNTLWLFLVWLCGTCLAFTGWFGGFALVALERKVIGITAMVIGAVSALIGQASGLATLLSLILLLIDYIKA